MLTGQLLSSLSSAFSSHKLVKSCFLSFPYWFVGIQYILRTNKYILWGFPEVLVVNNLPANAGNIRDLGSIPWSGRSPGGGHGNPLQYSCLENLMDRGAWQAIVHRVAQSQTLLKRLSTHAQKWNLLMAIENTTYLCGVGDDWEGGFPM